MRYPVGKRYFISEGELHQFGFDLKLVQCPHCGRVGFLNGHGFLRGYGEAEQEMVIRGRRFFCSNRHQRLGCGRTFSVFFVDVLIGFMVRARTLWKFVQGVAGSLSRKASWEKSAGAFSLASGYRLWRRLTEAQARIKELLCRQRPPPYSPSEEPLVQLLDHMRCVFPLSDCPFVEFQSRFQTPLLG